MLPRRLTVIPVLTGLVYAGIVAAWAVYLIPMALRRHEEVTRNQSIERFSSAMRVLSRKARDGGRTSVAPLRQGGAVLSPAPPRPSRAALQRAAHRRRRVLAMLVVASVGVAGAAALGVLPRTAVVVPVVLLACFFMAARRSVRRTRRLLTGASVDLAAQPMQPVMIRWGHAQDSGDEDTTTLTPEEVAAAAGLRRSEDGVAVDSESGSLWDPLPVTLPTYVDAPVVRRTVRSIDLGSEAWSSGHSAEASETAAAAEASAGADGVGAADVADSAEAEEKRAAAG